MKIRVQLMNVADAKELESKTAELLAFSKLLELHIQKEESRHYGNIFFVQLPKEEYPQTVQINGLLAFLITKHHLFEFYSDPSDPDLNYS